MAPLRVSFQCRPERVRSILQCAQPDCPYPLPVVEPYPLNLHTGPTLHLRAPMGRLRALWLYGASPRAAIVTAADTWGVTNTRWEPMLIVAPSAERVLARLPQIWGWRATPRSTVAHGDVPWGTVSHAYGLYIRDKWTSAHLISHPRCGSEVASHPRHGSSYRALRPRSGCPKSGFFRRFA